MFYLANEGFGQFIGVVIFLVVVGLARLAEWVRTNNEKQKKDAQRLGDGAAPGGGSTTSSPARQATGLESLLQALEQGSQSSRPSPSSRDDAPHTDPDPYGNPPPVREETYAPNPYAHETPAHTEEPRATGHRASNAALERARERVLESEQKAREAKRAAEQAEAEAARALTVPDADDSFDEHQQLAAEAGHALQRALGGSSTAKRVAAAGPFVASDLRNGIIWSTLLGQPRGVAGFGQDDLTAPPGLR